MYRARDATSGQVLAERLRPAHTHWTRLKGLLGTRNLEPGEGLWLRPCRQIHMIGMRYPVDVVFLDDELHIVHLITELAPGRVSPKIGAASSVLELPAGIAARFNLTIGGRVEIDGDADADSASWVDTAGERLCNVAVAALYLFFTAAHVAAPWDNGRWATNIPIVLQEALLVVLFLVRRRSVATSSRPFDWAVGIAGMLFPLLLRPAPQAGPLIWLGQPLQIFGLTLAVVSLAFLGRSVAVVAAHRGIKTAGIYRILRHPMYASYMVSYLGYTASYPTLRNCVITIISIAALNVRAIVEEHFLEHDVAYREYIRQVPWRFVPYVY